MRSLLALDSVRENTGLGFSGGKDLRVITRVLSPSVASPCYAALPTEMTERGIFLMFAPSFFFSFPNS